MEARSSMDFTTQGGKIYRPRPKAEVCKFLSPRGVKSIDDRADVRQCYSHMWHYMKESQAKWLSYDLPRSQKYWFWPKFFCIILEFFIFTFFFQIDFSLFSLKESVPTESISRPIRSQALADFDLPTNQQFLGDSLIGRRLIARARDDRKCQLNREK